MVRWRPLLTGRDAVPVWEAIAEIAAALRSAEEPADGAANPSIAQGDAGRALFFAYLAFDREAAASASPPAAPLPPLPAAVLESAEDTAGRLLDRAAVA